MAASLRVAVFVPVLSGGAWDALLRWLALTKLEAVMACIQVDWPSPVVPAAAAQLDTADFARMAAASWLARIRALFHSVRKIARRILLSFRSLGKQEVLRHLSASPAKLSLPMDLGHLC